MRRYIALSVIVLIGIAFGAMVGATIEKIDGLIAKTREEAKPAIDPNTFRPVP